jgi:hypothetical protein
MKLKPASFAGAGGWIIEYILSAAVFNQGKYGSESLNGRILVGETKVKPLGER